MPPPHTTPPVALCLGGMDPSGGAGLIRDALTLARLGVHPMAVSTAETLQNGLGCQAIQGPCMDPVARIETLGPHLTGAWGVKLGLCALETAVVKRLVATLNALHPRIRIWDPILAPSAGVGLHDGGELRELARILLSGGAWVVSPNRGEAAAIAGLAPDQIRVASPESLSRPLLELGAAAVWLKGGHTMGDTVQDLWITPTRIEALPAAPRLPGQRRGTGCTLASLWLGLRLLGRNDHDAAIEAADMLRAAWGQAFAPGAAGHPLFAPGAP